MNLKTKFAAFATMGLLATSPAFTPAALAATTNGEAIATVQPAASITPDAAQPLNFSSFIQVLPGYGYVVMDHNGNRSYNNAASNVGGSTGGKFALAGAPDYNVTVSLPTVPVPADAGPAGGMQLINFTSNLNSAGPVGTGALDSAGQGTLLVGATLEFGTAAPSQAAGNYHFTYPVTVNY